jgi:hypothetical protein
LGKISSAPELWTQWGVKVIQNIKLKEYQYFYFVIPHTLGNNFGVIRCAFKSLRTVSGKIECMGLVKDTKLASIVHQPTKKLPKYSKLGGGQHILFERQ